MEDYLPKEGNPSGWGKTNTAAELG